MGNSVMRNLFSCGNSGYHHEVQMLIKLTEFKVRIAKKQNFFLRSKANVITAKVLTWVRVCVCMREFCVFLCVPVCLYVCASLCVCVFLTETERMTLGVPDPLTERHMVRTFHLSHNKVVKVCQVLEKFIKYLLFDCLCQL